MSETQYITKQQAGLIREKKQVIVDGELERLYNQNGSVTPATVLDEARKETSPLHPYFEWDDHIAAEKHRLEQAMRMIMASKMVVILSQEKGVLAAKPVEVRRLLPAFRGEGFKMRNKVLDEEQTRTAMIERKKEALRAWCRSVVDIHELSTLRKLILKQLE